MGHHRFMSRFLRTASELFILTIISSKGEIHPYEVYQELLLEIFHSKHSQIQCYSKILHFGEKYLNYLQDSSKLNVELLEKEIRDFLPTGESIEITLNPDEKLKKNMIQILNHLIGEADTHVESLKGELKIWDSKTAIYQVMKELEREDLIKVARTEIYKGRARKIYSITDKGKSVVLRSLVLFGDLFQKIFPQITLFKDFQSSFLIDHRIKLIKFFEMIITPKQIVSILNNKTDFPLKQLFNEIFPLIGSESILKNLINVKKVNLSLFDIDALPADYRDIYIQMVLNQLRESKEYIENKIKEFQSLIN